MYDSIFSFYKLFGIIGFFIVELNEIFRFYVRNMKFCLDFCYVWGNL